MRWTAIRARGATMAVALFLTETLQDEHRARSDDMSNYDTVEALLQERLAELLQRVLRSRTGQTPLRIRRGAR